MTDLVLTDIDTPRGLAIVTMNRPDVRIPTSIAMLDALDTALDEVEASGNIMVLILRGAGRSFCSGLDLDEVLADESTIRHMLTRLGEVMRRLRRVEYATIAQVQGAAIGGGFGLMAVCDLRVTHPNAKIGYPPPSTGLSPALMSPWLIRLVGPSAARAMLVAGGTISGRAAVKCGIATHLADREDLEGDAARKLAHPILDGCRHALVAMKTLLNDVDGSCDDALLERCANVSADVIAHPETQSRLRELFPSRT